MIRNNDSMTTFIADKDGMQNFLKMTFQDEFNVEYKKGKAKFKTETEAKRAYDYLVEDDYLPNRGYGFTLNRKVIECRIINLTIDIFIDPLDKDPDYVKHMEEKYNSLNNDINIV